MNEDNELIFSIKLDEKDAEKRANVLRATIEQLTGAKKELDKANKAGTISSQEYTDALAQNRKIVTGAKAELAELNRTIDLQDKANRSAAGSMNQLKANLSLLTAQFNALSLEERQNAAVGGAFQKQIRATSDALKQQEEVLGDHRRSVGEYAKGTKQTNALLTDLGKTARASGEHLKTLDSSFGVFGGKLESIKSGLANTKAGLEATKLGLTGLKGAIAATGVGLLILALGTLYSYLSKTQEGLNFIERKTEAVSKVIQVLSDKAISVGRVIFQAFDNPKQALKDLGGAIMDNVINRFKALYEIAAAVFTLDFNRLNNGMIQLGTGVTDASGKISGLSAELRAAAAAGEKLAATNQDIRKAESELNVERARSRSEVERLKKISEDTTKSTKEREAAARGAYNTENGLLNRQLALQQRRINALKSERAEGKRTQAQITEINEAQAQYFEIQEESLGKQTELQNQLNSIRKEAADKVKTDSAAALAAAKETAKLAVEIATKRLDIAKLRGQDTLALEADLIRKQGAAEVLEYKKNSQVRQLIEAETLAKIYTLNVQKAAEQAALVAQTRKAGLEAQLALAKEGSATELRLQLALIRESAEAEKAELEKTTAATVGERALRNAQKAKIDADAARATLALEKAFSDKFLQSKQETADKEAAITHKMLARIGEDRAKNLANERELLEVQLIGVEAGSRKELAIRKALIRNRQQAELSAENLTAAAKKRINAQADKDIQEADKDSVKARTARAVQVAEGLSNVLSSLINANVEAQTKALDKQQEAALSSAALSADQRAAIEKDFQKKREALEKEAAKKRKAIAIAETIIGTAKAIVEASPVLPLQILAAITGAAQLAVIESQQFAKGGVPTFVSDRRGAYVKGAGTGTSDSIHARISNGESVINARSTEQFYPLLSWLNQLGGGRAFPGSPRIQGTADMVATVAPGTLSAYAGGGVPSGGGIDPKELAGLIKQGIAEAFREMPNPVVDVREVTTVQNRVQAREDKNQF